MNFVWLITTLPGAIITVCSVVVITVIGAFYMAGLWKKEKDTNVNLADQATTFVIASLKEQVAVLEKKVAEQAAGLQMMGLRLEEVVKENRQLKDLLQGRDEDTQKFQSMGFDVMRKVVPQIMDMTTKTNQSVERLYKAIEKHLATMEKQQTVTVTTGPSISPSVTTASNT